MAYPLRRTVSIPRLDVCAVFVRVFKGKELVRPFFIGFSSLFRSEIFTDVFRNVFRNPFFVVLGFYSENIGCRVYVANEILCVFVVVNLLDVLHSPIVRIIKINFFKIRSDMVPFSRFSV